jgi:UDP-glucuronate 4-epimerase
VIRQSTRILLTGGAGFIGSHVAEALLARAVQLTIVDNLDDFYPPAWKKINLEELRRAGDYHFLRADIAEPEAMRDIMAQARPEVVIHLGGPRRRGPVVATGPLI